MRYTNKQVHSNIIKSWGIVCYHYPTFEDYLKVKGFKSVTNFNHLLLSGNELVDKIYYHTNKGGSYYHTSRIKYFNKLLLTI